MRKASAAVLIGALSATLLWSGQVFAVLPDEVLKDPLLEARARTLSQDLRCLVCQNQSIDDSNAPLARDLRLIVRERLAAGDTDAQVIDYLVARYGNYVLLKPPLQRDTALLWAAPFAMLVVALMVSGVYLLRRKRDVPQQPPAPLNEDEIKILNSLTQES